MLGIGIQRCRPVRRCCVGLRSIACDQSLAVNRATMRASHENLSGGVSVFAAVVDAGTFAAASELMGMSPPGVSRAIARLEKKLKIRLFNRTTRSVSLTEEGRRFYEQVMPHLRGMEEAAA